MDLVFLQMPIYEKKHLDKDMSACIVHNNLKPLGWPQTYCFSFECFQIFFMVCILLQSGLQAMLSHLVSETVLHALQLSCHFAASSGKCNLTDDVSILRVLANVSLRITERWMPSYLYGITVAAAAAATCARALTLCYLSWLYRCYRIQSVPCVVCKWGGRP